MPWECPRCGIIHVDWDMTCGCRPPTLTMAGNSTSMPPGAFGAGVAAPVPDMGGQGEIAYLKRFDEAGQIAGVCIDGVWYDRQSEGLEREELLKRLAELEGRLCLYSDWLTSHGNRLLDVESDIAAHQQAITELARVVGLKEESADRSPEYDAWLKAKKQEWEALYKEFSAESFPELAARLAKMGEEAIQTDSAGVPMEPAGIQLNDICNRYGHIPQPGIVSVDPDRPYNTTCVRCGMKLKYIFPTEGEWVGVPITPADLLSADHPLTKDTPTHSNLTHNSALSRETLEKGIEIAKRYPAGEQITPADPPRDGTFIHCASPTWFHCGRMMAERVGKLLGKYAGVVIHDDWLNPYYWYVEGQKSDKEPIYCRLKDMNDDNDESMEPADPPASESTGGEADLEETNLLNVEPYKVELPKVVSVCVSCRHWKREGMHMGVCDHFKLAVTDANQCSAWEAKPSDVPRLETNAYYRIDDNPWVARLISYYREGSVLQVVMEVSE